EHAVLPERQLVREGLLPAHLPGAGRAAPLRARARRAAPDGEVPPVSAVTASSGDGLADCRPVDNSGYPGETHRSGICRKLLSWSESNWLSRCEERCGGRGDRRVRPGRG